MNVRALTARAALIAITNPLITKNRSTPQAPIAVSKDDQISSSRSTPFACAHITRNAATNRKAWTLANGEERVL